MSATEIFQCTRQQASLGMVPQMLVNGVPQLPPQEVARAQRRQRRQRLGLALATGTTVSRLLLLLLLLLRLLRPRVRRSLDRRQDALRGGSACGLQQPARVEQRRR